MHTHSRRRLFTKGVLLSLFAVLVMILTAQSGGNLTGAASDCIGKPYGSPGCPVRPAASSAESSVFNTCGNAIVERPEQCDKGRFNGKTDCSTECRDLYCGDGVISKDITEECEPETQEVYVQDKGGNLTTEIRFTGSAQCGWYCQPPVCTDDGSCTGGCRLQYIGECTASGAALSGAEESGTGTVALSSSGSLASSLSSASTSGSSLSSSEPAKCGDGVVGRGEECDDVNAINEDACTNSCKLPRCGDAIKQAREACDAGPRNSDSTPNVCRSNCTLPACGDGVIDKNEQCDASEENSDSAPNACRTTCRLSSCGDGVTDSNEECDDGNRLETDECTTLCKKTACGDGTLQIGEQCDWGAKNSDTEADACRVSCRLPRCGDKIIDTGEECEPSAGSGECGKDCKLGEKAAVGDSSGGPSFLSGLPGGMLPVTLSIAGVLLILTTLLFRRRIVRAFTPRGARSIDDIPLDQIEMPWHKW